MTRRKSIAETELRPARRPSRRKLTVADLVLRRIEVQRRQRARDFREIHDALTRAFTIDVQAVRAVVEQVLSLKGLLK
jgi:hypothetical protein